MEKEKKSRAKCTCSVANDLGYFDTVSKERNEKDTEKDTEKRHGERKKRKALGVKYSKPRP